MPRTIIEISGGVPLEHYAAIGKVASNWAALERLVDSAIWELSGANDEEGACITAQFAGIERRLDTFNALIRLRSGSDGLMHKINAFTREANDLAKERNRILHDPWVREKHTGVPHRFQTTTDPRPVLKYKAMPTDELNAIVERIADLIDSFDDLVRKDVIAELGSLRQTSPEPSTQEPLDNQT